MDNNVGNSRRSCGKRISAPYQTGPLSFYLFYVTLHCTKSDQGLATLGLKGADPDGSALKKKGACAPWFGRKGFSDFVLIPRNLERVLHTNQTNHGRGCLSDLRTNPYSWSEDQSLSWLPDCAHEHSCRVSDCERLP